MAYPDWLRRMRAGLAGQGSGHLRAKGPLLVLSVAVTIVVQGGAVALVVAGLMGKTPARSAVGSGPPSAGSKHLVNAGTKKLPKPAPALNVVSVTPDGGARDVDGTSPVTVRFSAALAPDSPLPTLSPSVSGTWKRHGDTATFTPASGFSEETAVTVRVPGGKSGVLSSAGESRGAGGRLASSVAERFTTAPFSPLRLQQLLAQLGYLPVTWSPTGAQPSGAAAQLAAAYHPPSGSFAWHGGYPSQLHSLWQQGSPNLVDAGAIRAFESQNNLIMDGEAGPAVWSALLQDAAANRGNSNGYTYAVASKASPETLTVWHDGNQVVHTLANTGIAQSPTADGTYPVYQRLYFQIMKGRNPNGSKYADPVHWIAYFNGSDAVHYYVRASYGWPQSLGCVEVPEGAAQTAYRYLTYGSLVTVQ